MMGTGTKTLPMTMLNLLISDTAVHPAQKIYDALHTAPNFFKQKKNKFFNNLDKNNSSRKSPTAKKLWS